MLTASTAFVTDHADSCFKLTVELLSRDPATALSLLSLRQTVRSGSDSPPPNSSPSLEIPDVSPDSGGMCLFFCGNPGAAMHSGRSLCLRESLHDSSTRGCHVTLNFGRTDSEAHFSQLSIREDSD